MTSSGWNVEYPLVGLRLGAAGCAAPAPVTFRLRDTDHALFTNAPFTTCTRQKYVPFGRPLTVSWVTPALVEFCNAIVEKLDEVLTCQLYPRIPLGSLTADHEIVNGESVPAPAAGESKLGAGGVAAKAGTAAAMVTTKKHTNATNERILICTISNFFKGSGRSSDPDGMNFHLP